MWRWGTEEDPRRHDARTEVTKSKFARVQYYGRLASGCMRLTKIELKKVKISSIVARFITLTIRRQCIMSNNGHNMINDA